MSFLNDGHARNLVTSLQVSKSFFHSAAATLCRRIEVPLYEYSSTKIRKQFPVHTYGVPCRFPMPYHRTWGVTAHQSLHSGLAGAYLNKIQHTYRDRFIATSTMREMYKYVRVVSVEPHDSCDRLAVSHPLPFVQTVIVRGGHKQDCLPSVSRQGLWCGFLPKHPFRLVLDSLCAGLICRDHTAPNLLSEHVETLVLRLEYETLYTCCPTRDLPHHFNPKRLVSTLRARSIRENICTSCY